MAESDKFRGRIIAKLRQLSFSWKPRYEAHQRARVAPATVKCMKCGVWIYEGQSEENYLNICLENPEENVIMDKACMDHIDPVIDPSKGWVSWDSYIERMFCSTDKFSCICRDCHDKKTLAEDGLRKTKRKKK